MDLVAPVSEAGEAAQRTRNRTKAALGLALDLLPVEHRLHGQQAQATDRGNSGGFYLVRVGNPLSQHLVAAADAEDDTAPVLGVQDRRLQAVLPEPLQIGNGALGAGEDDHIRLHQVFRLFDVAQGHIGDPLQGSQVRKVGDPGQLHHGDVDVLPRGAPVEPAGQAVLIIDIQVHIGHHSRHGDPAELFQDFNTGLQNGPVSPEFVHHSALDPGPLLLLQQGHRAVELGKNAAPVNVAYQQHGRIHQLGQAHVDNVFLLQVDLRRTSGPLDDDDVVFGGQGTVAFQYLRDELPLPAVVFHGAHIPHGLAVYDDLAAHIRSGL